MSSGVIIQAGQDNRTAGRATGGRAVSAGETGSRFREHVDARRFDDLVSVATCLKALVIDHNYNDIFLLRRSGDRFNGDEQQQQTEDSKQTSIHGVAFSLE